MALDALGLSKEEQTQLKAVFQYIDSDGDGLLSAKETKNAARLLGSAPFEVDESRDFNLQEFMKLMSEVSKQSLTMQPIEQQCQMLIGSTLRTDDPTVKLTRLDLQDFFDKCGDNVSVSRSSN